MSTHKRPCGDQNLNKKLKIDDDRVKAIFKKEIDKEIELRSSDLLTIEERIFETRRGIEKIRQSVVASYYDVSFKGELQPHPHPAVKDTFGGKRIKEEKLSEDEITNDAVEKSDNGIPEKLPRHVPPKYTDREIVKQFEPRGNANKEKFRLIVGNYSKWLAHQEQSEVTHKWTVYIKCKRENGENIEVGDIFSGAILFLHPSYKPCDVVRLSNPPFKLTKRGWGEFPLKVRIFFIDELEKPLDVVHFIKLDRTHSGLETFGGETVIDVWAHLIKAPVVEPEKLKKPLPSVSAIQDSNFFPSDILSDIFDFSEPFNIKTECGDVPIEDIDIKPLDCNFIPTENIKTEKVDEIAEESLQVIESDKIEVSTVENDSSVFDNAKNEVPEVEREVVDNSKVVSNLNNSTVENVNLSGESVKVPVDKVSFVENIKIKEEVIFEDVIHEEVIYDSDLVTLNDCDNQKALKTLPENSLSQPIVKVTEEPQKQPKKELENQRPVKIIKIPSLSGIKILPNNKIVLDSKQVSILKDLSKINGVKSAPNLNGSFPSKLKFTNFKLNSCGIVVKSPSKLQKPVIIQNVDKTMKLSRKIVPGVSLLKKPDKKPIQQSSEFDIPFLIKSCPKGNMEEAVRWLVKRFPLFDPRASDEKFREIHPYCAPSHLAFLQWPLGKQLASEFSRAKTISKLLPNVLPDQQPWSTVQIVDWCRLMAYTPSAVKNHSEKTIVEPLSLNFSPPPILDSKLLPRSTNIHVVDVDVRSQNTEDDEVDLPIEDHEFHDFLRRSCVNLLTHTLSDSALSVLTSTFKSVADDLIRRSYSACFIRHQPPSELIENDVKTALLTRTEFDIFTNEGLGDENKQL